MSQAFKPVWGVECWRVAFARGFQDDTLADLGVDGMALGEQTAGLGNGPNVVGQRERPQGRNYRKSTNIVDNGDIK
jgi:hypothetical protein